MEFYEAPWSPMELWSPMEAKGAVTSPMKHDEAPLRSPAGFHGSLWILMELFGALCNLTEPLKCNEFPMGSFGTLWGLMPLHAAWHASLAGKRKESMCKDVDL